MTGPELKAIREAHGLSLDAMGRELGYAGKHVRQQMHRYEIRTDPLPPGLLLRLIERGWYTPRQRAV